MLLFRKADEADIALIIELAMQVWPQTYTPILGPEQVDYMLNKFYSRDALAVQMREQQHTFVIAYADERPVAFASYAELGDSVFKLHKIYIASDVQGQGIGKQLLAYIVDNVKAAGAKALQLNVNIHNSSAKAFYQKTGFEHVGDEDIDIGSGYFMNDNILQLAL